MNLPRIDQDLRTMDREALMEEIIKLRTGIRSDRDSAGQNLCWYRPELWNLLPERVKVDIKLPNFFSFMWNCFLYRWRLMWIKTS